MRGRGVELLLRGRDNNNNNNNNDNNHRIQRALFEIFL